MAENGSQGQVVATGKYDDDSAPPSMLETGALDIFGSWVTHSHLQDGPERQGGGRALNHFSNKLDSDPCFRRRLRSELNDRLSTPEISLFIGRNVIKLNAH